MPVIRIEQPVLRAMLARVVPFSSRPATIPVLESVRIALGDDLAITGTCLDIDATIRTRDFEGEGAGAICVPARRLLDVVRWLDPAVRVELRWPEEGGAVEITSGATLYSLASYDATDFPEVEWGETLAAFTVPAPDLRLLLTRGAFAVSRDETRYYINGIYLHVHDGAPRRLTSIQNRNKPYRWQRERRAAIDRGENPPPVRVFGGSLMDPFDNEVPQEWRVTLWEKVRACPDLDWIFVTKRVGNVAKMAPIGGFPKNVIILATIVNQEEAKRDRRKLLSLKGRICHHVGVSYEPALGSVDWWQFLYPGEEALAPLDWLIVGGESTQGKHKARPFEVRWARDAIRQTRGTGCAVFIKQMGAACVMNRTDAVQPVALGAGWKAIEAGSELGVVTFRDKAGGDPAEWPADLRVREFPVIGGAA